VIHDIGRPATRASRGMVTSPHALASQSGVAILRAGGSAVDAAIAAAAVLSVVYPHMTSLGGDAFWLIYDAATGAVRSLEAAGRASATASLDWFTARGLHEIPVRGIVPATLTVPGAVDGWCQAHATYGRLPLATDLAAAVGCARDGFPITARVAQWIERSADVLAADPAAARIFLADGTSPSAGWRAHQSGPRAHTERLSAGRAGFYEGDRARWRDTRASTAASSPSVISRCSARRGARPSSATYRGVTIHDDAAEPGRVGPAGAAPPRALGAGRAPFLGPDHVHLLVCS
jgi:gamma-glutamyltranspeptidase/glutathione hydrolase